MLARRESDDVHNLSDSELIRRFKLGSDEALETLLGRHSDALYGYCSMLLRNREDAEDVCQESMTRAITRVDTLESEGSFRSWLFSIARNLSMDSFRRRRHIVPMPDDENMPAPLHGDSPQLGLETREEYQTVAQAMEKLAASHRRVLMLREVEGLSYADIAQQLDTSKSAVETLLFRARRRLKDEYSR